MQNLKTVLEKMLAAKVRCTLSTLNSYLGKEYDWAAVSDLVHRKPRRRT